VGWGLIGGEIDRDKDLISTIEGKVKREVGIEISDIKQIHQMPVTHVINGQAHRITGYYFVSKTNAILSDINLTKGQKAAFFSLDEIKNKSNIVFAVKEILSKHEYLIK